MKNLILSVLAASTLIGNPVSTSDAAKGSVTLINAFIVPDGKEVEALAYWDKAAEFMKKQPGYIFTTLHKAVLPDAKFRLINVAKWENADAFKKASLALRTDGDLKPVEGVVPYASLYTIIRSD